MKGAASTTASLGSWCSFSVWGGKKTEIRINKQKYIQLRVSQQKILNLCLIAPQGDDRSLQDEDKEHMRNALAHLEVI